MAMKIIHGDEEGQYNQLWNYANEIRRSNHVSTSMCHLMRQQSLQNYTCALVLAREAFFRDTGQ